MAPESLPGQVARTRCVGIRGWSFGGSLAVAAVLRRPDVFHVAVAGAGVTDRRLYNAHWRERFLGHPDAFPERYEACSLLPADGHRAIGGPSTAGMLAHQARFLRRHLGAGSAVATG